MEENKKLNILFWCVDCQEDFLNPSGKLYVKSSEEIIPNLERLSNISRGYNVTVVTTGDYHTKESKELSNKPDFINTFPEHCMVGTKGINFIKEVNPRRLQSCFITPNKSLLTVSSIIKNKDIVLYKDDFNIFKGNIWASSILEILNPDIVIIYGVTSNICVHFAVLGILKRDFEVIVVKDAIKELPNLDINTFYDSWIKAGAEFKTTQEIIKLVQDFS